MLLCRGLGKSLQALTALAVLRLEKNMRTGPFLVVCPASVTLHWAEEIGKYFPPELLRPQPFAAGNSFTGELQGDSAVVVVVSFEALRRDSQRTGGGLHTVVWEAVVLDEAHLIKNPAAGCSKAVFALRSKHRIALTGTPVQNQVSTVL
jgi:SNF2 family DNA or RNA helicase